MFDLLNKFLTSWTISTIIIGAFFYFIYQASKMYRIYHSIKKVEKNNDLLAALTSTRLSPLRDAYIQTITIETVSKTNKIVKKTNIPASEFFSDFKACKMYSLNLRSLDAASGILVGLGLLGTFWGLTSGINGFDSSNVANIQYSIQELLNGMGTAFVTSLVGMFSSLLYIPCDKFWRNNLSKHMFTLTEKLDELYYIDDVTLTLQNQDRMFTNLYVNMKNMMLTQTQSILDQAKSDSLMLQEKLTYKNNENQTVTIGNAIREILTENTEQTRALKSFSTDVADNLVNLSDALNDNFENKLAKPIQEKFLALIENVDLRTKMIIEHIDGMASQMASPATDMIQNVVEELKSSMLSIVSEFKQNISSSTSSELENLASQLGTATNAMAEFPNNMANISSTLQVTIEEVKRAISDISNTSASANSTAMQQMQEQITFATGAISSAINEVKDVMSTMSQSSQQQSDEMANKMAEAAEKMGKFLNGTVTNLSTSVQDSIQGITKEIGNIVAEISSTSANANETAMKQMQEQVTFATDAMNTTISEVKQVMTGLTLSSQQQSDSMVNNLSTATEKMGTFLNGTVSNITSSVQESINGMATNMNSTIAEISKVSAEANSTAMQQVHEQIALATNAIGSAIGEVKEVMSGISQSSQQQNLQMINNLAEAAEKMGHFLDNTVSNISSTVQDSMMNITKDVNTKQAELVALQETTTQQTKELLNTFNIGLDRLEKMNEYISNTMDMFQKAQGHITGSTAHLENITADMKVSTELFNKSQTEYGTKMENIQRNSQTSLESMNRLMKEVGDVSGDYAHKFEIIKDGLGNIFAQLQSGLTQYSKTVQSSTQEYLNKYASSLTNTTDALASTIQQQNEMVEMLSDALNSYKRK